MTAPEVTQHVWTSLVILYIMDDYMSLSKSAPGVEADLQRFVQHKQRENVLTAYDADIF